MRKLPKPTLCDMATYQRCLDGVLDTNLKARLQQISPTMHEWARFYDQYANSKNWYQLTVSGHGDDDVIVGEIKKGELRGLYNPYMTGRAKPARSLYDALKTASSRCPFCGSGITKELDHYLPQSRFPFFTVLPVNLVPSCRDCNHEKRNRYATSQYNQTLHPYYDHGHFIEERWLYADVIEGHIPTLSFRASPPNSWDDVSKQRIEAHFSHYKLAERYTALSSEEVTSASYMLAQTLRDASISDRRKHLSAEASSKERIHKNSWETATYHALLASDWYCSEGFKFATISNATTSP